MEEIRLRISELVQRVARMFYEPHHVVIMEIMLHYLVLDEEDLADKMKLLPREFNRMAVRLREDKLLSSETISDVKEDGRQNTVTKFFLDFRMIRDVVKYKIYTMTQKLEKRMRINEKSQDFSCSSCNIAYSLLDVQSFLCTETFTFKCPECEEELKEKKEEEGDKESASNLFATMMEELEPIIQQLKEIDRLGISELQRGKFILPDERATKPVEDRAEEKVEEKPEEEHSFEILNTSKLYEIEAKNAKLSEPMISLVDERKTGHGKESAAEEILTVQGVPKKFSEITESDKEMMDDEEYEKYFEVSQKIEGSQ
ncbi:transcription initiation factor TFIIE subunit alpha [Nematocida sp. LUAm3]|nr:transcription initiation factor TFIIE subunit alpha [Nematocida sp. LUAm3]KAI5175786.1 transcription initiation factor TFIIE subunit alpha [Nematocida sp. LUAm2]KAI5178282.1 transcription initiation factor TFIIE subunit alpha [Nematocida sp. LUAm1]